MNGLLTDIDIRSVRKDCEVWSLAEIETVENSARLTRLDVEMRLGDRVCKHHPQSAASRSFKPEGNMGRSQVERNRRLGRPGSKGRGGGGRSNTSSGRGGGRVSAEARHKPASNLGSNEWRYQQEETDGGVDNDVDGMLAPSYGYAEHGPAHDEIASTLLGGDDGTDSGGGGSGVSLNLDNLARSLRKVPTQDLLNFPPHIAREYDKKYGELVDEKRAKTILELRAAGATTTTTKTTLGSNTDAKLVATEGPDTRSTTTSNEAGGSDKKPVKAGAEPESSTVADGNAGGDGEDAEDLDAWLDSVI